MIDTAKRDIRKLKLEELKAFFVEKGDKAFRAQQVYEWLWQKSAKSFDQMTNISLETRDMLKANFVINHIKVDNMQRSTDGTIKNAVTLHDGLVVESVLIPAEKRITACVSSQVGCSLACKFCATARLKRQRNLSVDEIYDQVAAIKEQAEVFFGRPLTNIVFMGMGEPLSLVLGLDANGKERWRLSYDLAVMGAPMISQQNIVFVGTKGEAIGAYFMSKSGVFQQVVSMSDAPPLCLIPAVDAENNILFSASDELGIVKIGKLPVQRLLPY